MKSLLKVGSALLFAVVLSFSITSCDKDEDVCYECGEYIASDSTTVAGLTLCTGEDNGFGVTLTTSQIEATVDAFELAGGTCTKQ